jgi:rhamnosyl/mannosyltransferase
MLFFIRLKLPLIVHWHGDIQKKGIVFFLPLQNWMLRRSDKIIVTSNQYLHGSSHLKEFKQKCVIIPIGIPDEAVGSPLNRNSSENKMVFSLGRLIYYKGFSHLVKAGKFLDENIEVIIAGDGNDRQELSRLIEKDNLHNRVKLIGKVTEEKKQELLSQCNVFCLPSINKAEAFGVVLLEAMSFSKPLVTFHIEGSGVMALNQNKVTGLVVPDFDEEKLAGAINTICNDVELQEELGRRARHSYESNFTIDVMGKKIEELYDEILAN